MLNIKYKPSVIVRDHAIMSLPELRALILRTGVTKIYVNQSDFCYLSNRVVPGDKNDKFLVVDGCKIVLKKRKVIDFSNFKPDNTSL